MRWRNVLLVNIVEHGIDVYEFMIYNAIWKYGSMSTAALELEQTSVLKEFNIYDKDILNKTMIKLLMHGSIVIIGYKLRNFIKNYVTKGFPVPNINEVDMSTSGFINWSRMVKLIHGNDLIHDYWTEIITDASRTMYYTRKALIDSKRLEGIHPRGKATRLRLWRPRWFVEYKVAWKQDIDSP